MTDKLTGLLEGSIPPGIYRLTDEESVPVISQQAAQHGWQFFHLDGTQIASGREFLQACAAALQFPRYCDGSNWEALEDGLADLTWAPTRSGYVLLYDEAGRLAAAAPEQFAIALDSLCLAVENWRATDTPFIVLLRGLDAAAAPQVAAL